KRVGIVNIDKFIYQIETICLFSLFCQKMIFPKQYLNLQFFC
ncbi:hypothetical protein M153_5730003, partial [Pseudoloma neurophilia]